MNPTYLVPGIRTPFCKVDGPLKNLDAIQMSLPVVQAMAKIARPDLMIWGTVIPSLRWSNIARSVDGRKARRDHPGVLDRASVLHIDGRRV
jgi:hypothetical protein